MKKAEFQEELKELEEAGVIEIKRSRNGTSINFTEDGWNFTEMAIGLNTDMQLFLFQLLWENQYQNMGEYERLIRIGMDLKEEPGINIFRTIEANEDKLEGLELKQDHLPEEFVKQFDP